MKPLVVIPAAGRSRRMRGRDKLLETIDGVPLLRRQAQAATGAGASVLVLLPEQDVARREALIGLRVGIESVLDARDGMAATLRHAAASAGQRPLAILLPDVPGVTSAEVRKVLDAFDGDHVVRASDPEGRPGTPIVFPVRLLPRFARLLGDEGARSIIEDEDVRLLRFSDDRATRDLDTPEAWARWRRDMSRPS